MMSDYELFDADTNEALGLATDEQRQASSATDEGIILVDQDGTVRDAPHDAAYGPVRRVYVG